MDTFLEVIFMGFIYTWLLIIATIPNVFMGGLTNAVVATVLTYFKKDSPQGF
ncbi:MAG: hypothetical protein OEV94_06215 [Deltaproteobacteria bacterium]|nr:hypothetical protein [Deltaproteobacteria bacterium]